MNTAQRLTSLTLVAAALAAVFMVHGARPAPRVVQLEPVHMTAQRVPAAHTAVVQLPRVEVVALSARKPA